jgi:uncharacterized membrane protein
MRLLAAGVLAAVFAGAPASAHTANEKQEKVEEVEEVEAVEVVEAESGEAGERPEGLYDLVGRLHPMLVHMPIAWIILLFLFELLALKRTELAGAGPLLSVLVLASLVPAMLTGLVRVDHFVAAGSDLAPALAHRNAMFTTAAIVVVAVGLRFVKRAAFTGIVRQSYVALLALAAFFVSLGGHLGGELVYGENYLPW